MTESPKALQAFEVYWSLGDDRTLERVAQQCAKSASLIRRWSHVHSWQDRIRARIADQAAAVDAEKARQLAGVEAQLVKDGIEAGRLAMDAIRRLATMDRISAMAAVQLLAQARASALRGFRQPESVVRQEQTGKDGGPVVFTIEIDSRRGEEAASE